MNAFFIAPAISGVSLEDPDLDPPHPRAAARAAGQDPGRARPPDRLPVGLWETITGRSRPKRANLDTLFLVPSAAITLQTALGLTPTGDGSVCYRAAAGAGLRRDPGRRRGAAPRRRRTRPRSRPAPTATASPGSGHRDPDDADVAGLCTDLHAVNTTLESAGFGPALLCSLVPFADPRAAAWAWSTSTSRARSTRSRPPGQQQRDNLLEIQVRDALSARAARSSRSCPAGWPCGAPRASEPARRARVAGPAS